MFDKAKAIRGKYNQRLSSIFRTTPQNQWISSTCVNAGQKEGCLCSDANAVKENAVHVAENQIAQSGSFPALEVGGGLARSELTAGCRGQVVSFARPDCRTQIP